MAVRVLSLLGILCVLLLCNAPASVRAQSQENGAIIVTVTDAANEKPVDNAQVFLLGGDTPQSSLSNAKGVLIFENVQSGVYRMKIQADGYEATDFTNVEVADGQRIDVAAKLVPKLRIIASVVAHSSVNIHAETIGEGSAQRKVSQSLSDALNKLAGVSVDDALYGGNSAFNVSLRNADASQTAMLIDGMHVSGAVAGLAAGAQELFSGASVNFAPSAFGSAGSVNFMTLQPTKQWSYSFGSQVGNYGATSGAWSVTGGSGKVTTAFERAVAGADLPLNGMTYADQTGSTYEHLGGWARASNVIKLNVALSPASNVKLGAISGRNRLSNICNNATTLLPCGEGLGAGARNAWNYETVTFESLTGHLQYDVFVNAGRWSSDTAMPNRAVNGTRIPYRSSTTTPWFSYGGYTSETKRRHTVTTGFYADGQTTYATSTFNSTGRPQGVQSQRDGGAWIQDKTKANDKLAFSHSISESFATGAGSSLELYDELTWTPSKSETFSLGLGLGSANPGQSDPEPLGDPLTGDYDCFNQSVYVNGPGDATVRQASQSYDAGWRHTFKGGFLNVDIYRRNLAGQMMRAAVPVLSEPASLFPNGSVAGYLQNVYDTWMQPTVCGSMPFNPNRIFVSTMVSGLSQVNQGVTVNGRLPLGKNVMVFPTYATASAYFSTLLDPRLLSADSYYAVGAQLPHRPLHTAGVTFDGVMPRSRVEWLANAQYTSANNSFDLPGYTIYGAGLVFHGSLGDITMVESNIFGTHTGLFSTYQNVNPMPLRGGGTFAFASTPLPPRSLNVQYQIKWHQHASPPKEKAHK